MPKQEKTKSKFDLLFESIMNEEYTEDYEEMSETEELEGLGIDAGEEGALGDDESVTLTLPVAVAQQLCDIITASLPAPDADSMEGDELEFEEDEEVKKPTDNYGHGIGGKKAKMGEGKTNKISKLKPRSGGNNTKPTGNGGDHGHPLMGKKPHMGEGGSNKVGTLKPNTGAFD